MLLANGLMNIIGPLMHKIVLDTNIYISSIGINSPYRLIFDKLKNNKFILSVSNDIVFEYYDVISRKMTESIAENIIQYLKFASNVLLTEIHYKWELIDKDKSDNKFVDCFMATKADYLVTNDKHFNILKKIDFPKIALINGDDFMNILALDV